MSDDVEVFVDPVCPFCWVTAQWVGRVQERNGMRVQWRLISLAVLNDRPGAYDDKPEAYPAVHHVGRQLLRVAAAARAEYGARVVGPLYRAMGSALWERPADVEAFDDVLAVQARGIDAAAALADAGLPVGLAGAQDDERWDRVLVTETEEALGRVGGDVGTPVISLQPPDGPAFFGPVISEVPHGEEALRYWEALTTLAEMPGFAEIKRPLRTMPSTELLAPLAGQATSAR